MPRFRPHRALGAVLIVASTILVLTAGYPSPDPAWAAVQGQAGLQLPAPEEISETGEIIGFSVEGRPLEVYRFGSGPHSRLIVSGIHGGYESNTVQLAWELMAFLGEFPEIVPPQATLYILPVLNPDGLARSRYYEGRFNANQVDLNRNFPADWKAVWPNPGCWGHLPTSGGAAPASEPETQALMDFIDRHRITAVISYHSAANALYPGGIPPDLRSMELARALSAVSDYRYPPPRSSCQLTGTLPDWAAAHGIPAVDVELPDHEGTHLAQNLKVIDRLLSWYPSDGRRNNIRPKWRQIGMPAGDRRR